MMYHVIPIDDERFEEEVFFSLLLDPEKNLGRSTFIAIASCPSVELGQLSREVEF